MYAFVCCLLVTVYMKGCGLCAGLLNAAEVQSRLLIVESAMKYVQQAIHLMTSVPASLEAAPFMSDLMEFGKARMCNVH